MILMVLAMGFGISPGILSAQNMGNEIQSLKLLTNPELYNETDIYHFTKQNIAFLLEHAAGGPFTDTHQNRLLKQEASFFLKFIDRKSTDDIYKSIGDLIYLRMPRRIDGPLRDSLILSIVGNYKRIIKQWRNLGLQEPKGFIFVWVISGIDEMHLRFNTSTRVTAFALPCRYVVIPYNVISVQMQSELERQAFFNNKDPAALQRFIAKFLDKSFKTNLAHELTHVMVSSTVGYPEIDYMGEWFHEGTAIWLSGNNEQDLADEYKDYKHLFDYIRMKYGNGQFKQFVKDSITLKSTGESLRKNLAIHDEIELRKASQCWFAEIGQMETGLAVLLVFLVGFAVYRWVRTEPSYLFFLGYLFVWIVCYWRYGFFNLWTDSSIGNAAFYIGAAVLMATIAVIIARQVYYSLTIHGEIKAAKIKLEMASAVRAERFFPFEFDEARQMVERAELYRQRWKNKLGRQEAGNAAGQADRLVEATSIERKKQRTWRVYSKAKRLIAELQIKATESRIPEADMISPASDLERLERMLGQIPFQIKRGEFLEAYQTARHLIKKAKQIGKSLPA